MIDVGFRTLYAFFIVEVVSRRVVRVGVTRHPTDTWLDRDVPQHVGGQSPWVVQQLREATPFGIRPRFLIRDNDSKFGTRFYRVAATMCIAIVRTPFRAPRANAVVERFLGSVRRECLDHLLILSERHLLQVLHTFSAYFNAACPYQGIGQALPDPVTEPRSPSGDGPMYALPVLGGLHHDYQRVA